MKTSLRLMFVFGFLLVSCGMFGPDEGKSPFLIEGNGESEIFLPSVGGSSPGILDEFEGSVEIEEGNCCVGGTEGESLAIQTAFSAESPEGAVTEMRTQWEYGGACASVTEMAALPWEPFVPEKSYTITPVINWVGFYVSAQFMDEVGNLSPVFCDDVSVEGMPSPN